MSDEMIALLITIGVVTALVLWLPVIHTIARTRTRVRGPRIVARPERHYRTYGNR